MPNAVLSHAGAMTPRPLIARAAAASLLWFATSFMPGSAQVPGVPVPGVNVPAPAPPRSPREAAPIDLTGYWVPLITEDWRLRMFTPAKGDYTAVPLNPQGRQVADGWDPAADEAAGAQCRSYGAPNIMRKPGRLHITWQDDETLKLEFDAGTQTRLFSFGSRTVGTPGDWQGVSQASWEFMPAPITSLVGTLLLPADLKDPRHGALSVTTTQLKAGYLRSNGVPYSADAELTEYFDVVRGPNQETYLLVSSIVRDPTYLTQPFMLTTQWRKQQDGAGWRPAPCVAR